MTNEIRNHIEDCISGKFYLVPFPAKQLTHLTMALLPGTITLFYASAGATKSFYLNQCIQFWIENEYKVACLMLEENKRFHSMRMLAQMSGSIGVIDPQWCKDNPDTARQLAIDYHEALCRYRQHIWTTTSSMSFMEVIAWVEQRAKSGNRIIAIDPITAAHHSGRKRHEEEALFVVAMGKIAVEYDTSIFILMHPAKNTNADGLDDLAGSARFGQLTQCVIKLTAHEEKESDVFVPGFKITEPKLHNRTMEIKKSRNGPGNGKLLAYSFTDRFQLKEHGLIVKKKKDKK